MATAEEGGGRFCTVEGKELRNFGSCSYLSLERHPDLVSGIHNATEKFGTQFSFSRAFLQSSLYEELESLLESVTGGLVLVTPSTTLAHLAALPVLVADNDLVLVDQFAHASLHMATELLHETEVQLVRHNNMNALEEKIQRAVGEVDRVWYICDGLYSMLGDFAPFEELKALLKKYPKLHLYIDDAHSTSWKGTSGRGAALEYLAGHERVVVALSLNKAFSAAGGALVLPNEAWRRLVRRCGGPMLFSGPIQPPMLGAAVASAKLHLSPALGRMQREIEERIDRARQQLLLHGVSVATDVASPIFLVQCDSSRSVFSAAHRIKEAGFYCSVSVFPAVPMNKPSIRFTVGLHNTLADIDDFVAALAAALSEEVSAELESVNAPSAPTGT